MTDLQEFVRQNEVSRLLNTKTVVELVHQLVSERELHKRDVDKLKRLYRNKKTLQTNQQKWTKTTLSSFQHVLNQERKKLLDDNKHCHEIVKIVQKVNTQLESDNVMLIGRIKRLELDVIKLESRRMVEHVLLKQTRLKEVVQDNIRLQQAELVHANIAIEKAFAFASNGGKRLQRIKKLQAKKRTPKLHKTPFRLEPMMNKKRR